MTFVKFAPLLILLSLITFIAQGQNEIFDEKELLKLTLKGDIEVLLNDRGDNPEYHPISLWYYTIGMSTMEIDLKARTRGNFRRQRSNCQYPPILLNFKNDDSNTQNSLFKGQNQMKLVMPCQQDKYVVREYLVYELYKLFTEQSFNARLVMVTLDDTVTNKKSKPMYGILLEDEDKLAERNGMQISHELQLKPERTSPEEFHRMAVFQYFIGNTDWSVQYRHNIKLIAKDSTSIPITVPYDFDHSGIVYSPYAKPSEALELLAVQERRYRGYCQSTMLPFEKIFEEFNMNKTDIYNLYTSNLYLDKGYKSWSRKYIDKFYKTINDPKRAKRAFAYPCDPNGTGNVVIRGLGR